MTAYTLDETAEKVGAKIKQLRIDAGYTSYENFAVTFSLDRKQYWRMEKGANIRLATLLEIVNIHKLTLEEFFKGL